MRIEYKQTPPQAFVARTNRYIQESQLPRLTVQLRWVRLEEDEPESHSESQQQQGTSTAINPVNDSMYQTTFFPSDTYPSHPYGYKESRNCPVLRGQDSCPYCLCSPCVIMLPPDFLCGACGPHPTNDEKWYRLYRSFWRLLNSLGVWRDEEYLRRKELRTALMDKREIIPKCVITVSNNSNQ